MLHSKAHSDNNADEENEDKWDESASSTIHGTIGVEYRIAREVEAQCKIQDARERLIDKLSAVAQRQKIKEVLMYFGVCLDDIQTLINATKPTAAQE